LVRQGIGPEPGRRQEVEPVHQTEPDAQQRRRVAQIARQPDPSPVRPQLGERAKEILGDALRQKGGEGGGLVGGRDRGIVTGYAAGGRREPA
jgi:hypothetical protein